jgi:mannose-6-phosphate isomerase
MVARLKHAADANFQLQQDKPYAELWMGTHPNGPSTLTADDGTTRTLSEWLQVNPWAMGLANHGGLFANPHSLDNQHNLPFLAKVLSIEKALSIQAHPSREQAQLLFKASPSIYKDPNHKPEMLVALTPFEALCGIREMKEILFFLESLPELAQMAGGESAVEELRRAGSSSPRRNLELGNLFQTILEQPQPAVTASIDSLLARIPTLNLDGSQEQQCLASALSLCPRLHSQFPHDVGIFVALLLNFVHLLPGESMFLSAGLLHAYISGDCVEIMSSSDNVVRAGLTPKLKDVPTLLRIMDARCGSPSFLEPKILCGDITDNTRPFMARYAPPSPPIDEFEVTLLRMPRSNSTSSLSLIPSCGASVILVTQGKARLSIDSSRSTFPVAAVATPNNELDVSPGRVVFVCANATVEVQHAGGDEVDDLVLFRAQINSDFTSREPVQPHPEHGKHRRLCCCCCWFL